jgi:hypothetical protein
MPLPCHAIHTAEAAPSGRAERTRPHSRDVQRESRADAVGMAHYGTRPGGTRGSSCSGGGPAPAPCAELLEPATARSVSRLGRASAVPAEGTNHRAESSQTHSTQTRRRGAARPIRAHAPVGGAPAVTPHGLLSSPCGVTAVNMRVLQRAHRPQPEEHAPGFGARRWYCSRQAQLSHCHGADLIGRFPTAIVLDIA